MKRFLLGSLAVVLIALSFGCATTPRAKVPKPDAERLAPARTPEGSTVKESELEKENGRLVWSFDIATPGTADVTEVQVDAVSGQVVSVEKETPAQQQAEKAQDTKK